MSQAQVITTAVTVDEQKYIWLHRNTPADRSAVIASAHRFVIEADVNFNVQAFAILAELFANSNHSQP